MLAKLWGYIIGAGVILAGIFAIRRSGVKAEQQREQALSAKESKVANEIDTSVRNLSERDLDAGLQSFKRKK